METQRFDITWRTLWRIGVFAALVALLYFSRNVLGVFIIGVVVSLGLDPIVNILERFKINRLLGTIFVFLLALILFAGVVYFVVPTFVTEVSGFVTHFGSLFAAFDITVPQRLLKNLALNLESALGFLSAANISISGTIGSFITNIFFTVTTIVISFYLTLERDGTERMLRAILPDTYERSTFTVFSRFKAKIRYWFSAQLALSVIVGIVVAVGLWLLGVRYAVVIGLLAAVLELVPIIGPIITGALAFLVASSDSLTLGLYTLLFFFIVQQVENHVLVPLVMGKTVKVHPIMVILSLLVGGQVGGFVGVVLAVPIAVMTQEIFTYIAERKQERRPFV